MQPDYNRDLQGLVQQWYDAAEKKEVDGNERKELYHNTEQVVKILRELKDSGQIEKVKALSQILIQNFNRTSGDLALLAQLVVRHKGAYKSLHQLFQLVTEINNYPQAFTTNDSSLSTGHLSSIITFNSDLNYLATNQPSIPKITEIEKLILSNLDLKSIFLLGKTSKHHDKLVRSYLVDLLNIRKININDLGLNSITEIINYFGKDNCSKITNLDLTGVYKFHEEQTSSLSSGSTDDFTCSTTSGEDESFGNAVMYSAKIESVNIAECFPHLRHFTLSNYWPLEKFSISNLHLPKNLESLNLSNNCRECRCLIADWSLIGDLKSLKSLDISKNFLREDDLTFLEKLDSLEVVNLCLNSPKDPTILKNNLKLVSLDITFTRFKDISFIKGFPLLETFIFNNGSQFNNDVFATMNVLSECPSLKHLAISSTEGSVKKQFLDFLKLPNLESLIGDGAIDGSHFLTACTSLKELCCKLNNLDSLKNCTEITRLTILSSIVDLSTLPDLKKLERISLVSCTVNDLSNLEKFPSLKIVHLGDCKGVSDEQVEMLTSKGIAVSGFQKNTESL